MDERLAIVDAIPGWVWAAATVAGLLYLALAPDRVRHVTRSRAPARRYRSRRPDFW